MLDVAPAQAIWTAYLADMRQLKFSGDTPVYMASGLLSYGATDGVNASLHGLRASGLHPQRSASRQLFYVLEPTSADAVFGIKLPESRSSLGVLKLARLSAGGAELEAAVKRMTKGGVASAVHYKEQFLDPAVLKGTPSISA